ncbi:MAG: fatty acid desaturase [Ignavibacteriaceae bacterium]|nr:fatty acid desaturase [Ignavibacteriaceae bacterium]
MGILIALIIIFTWFFHLSYMFVYLEPSFTSVTFYIHILLQVYLYTGLFITAHDSMHRTVSKNKTINKLVGQISTFLYAGLSYNRLIKNHFKHHKTPGSENDPDYNIKSQNFFIWWGSFMIRYATIWQLLVMAAAFNILKIYVPEINLWFFWVIPAVLSSVQLFYFGTYLPHKQPHTHEMEPHKARTQKKNHLWAMISCYFFGYHFEHHESPQTPWWRLYQSK